jgi:CRISPR-associated protein Cmr6
MPALMRNQLDRATRVTSSAHAGLLLNRGLTDWEEGEKPKKAELIAKVCAVKPCALYKKAFDRWVGLTAKPEQFASLSAKIEGRMFVGLATGGAIETGVSTQHSYGMPLLAGSAVKGAVRAYAETVGIDAEYIAVLFGEDEDTVSDGRKAGAGCLVWHDAWWYPHDNTLPFVAEVVTVHHQKYYGGDGEATDFDSPIPNQQVAVQGSFYFVIEGETQWVALAKQLLKKTVAQQGLGAKTAAGYGYSAADDKMAKVIKEKHDKVRRTGITDPVANLRYAIANLSEDELVQGLTKGKNKFKETHEFENWQTVYALIKECHAGWVESWTKEPKGSNKEKAFKALNKVESP